MLPQFCRYSDQAAGSKVQGSIPGRGREDSLQNVQTGCGAHVGLCACVQFHLAVRLICSGSVLPQCCTMCTGTTFTFTVYTSVLRYAAPCGILCVFATFGKGKVNHITSHEGPKEEKRYSSTLSLTSALNVASGQRHAPAALPPGKTRYPLYRRLGGH